MHRLAPRTVACYLSNRRQPLPSSPAMVVRCKILRKLQPNRDFVCQPHIEVHSGFTARHVGWVRTVRTANRTQTKNKHPSKQARSKEADKPASNQASTQACKRAGRQAASQQGQPASKEGSKASKAGKARQQSKEARKQAR